MHCGARVINSTQTTASRAIKRKQIHDAHMHYNEKST